MCIYLPLMTVSWQIFFSLIKFNFDVRYFTKNKHKSFLFNKIIFRKGKHSTEEKTRWTIERLLLKWLLKVSKMLQRSFNVKFPNEQPFFCSVLKAICFQRNVKWRRLGLCSRGLYIHILNKSFSSEWTESREKVRNILPIDGKILRNI